MTDREGYFIAKSTINSNALKSQDELEVQNLKPLKITLPSTTFMNELKIFSPLDSDFWHTRLIWDTTKFGFFKGIIQTGTVYAESHDLPHGKIMANFTNDGLIFYSQPFSGPTATEIFSYGADGLKLGTTGGAIKWSNSGQTSTMSLSAGAESFVDISFTAPATPRVLSMVNGGSASGVVSTVQNVSVSGARLVFRNLGNTSATNFWIVWYALI